MQIRLTNIYYLTRTPPHIFLNSRRRELAALKQDAVDAKAAIVSKAAAAERAAAAAAAAAVEKAKPEAVADLLDFGDFSDFEAAPTTGVNPPAAP